MDDFDNVVHKYLAEMLSLLKDILRPSGHIGIVPKEIFKIKGKDTFIYQKPESEKWLHCSVAQKDLLKRGKLQACRGPWCQAYQDENGRLVLHKGSSNLPEMFTFDDDYFAQKEEFQSHFKEGGSCRQNTRKKKSAQAIRNEEPKQWGATS